MKKYLLPGDRVTLEIPYSEAGLYHDEYGYYCYA